MGQAPVQMEGEVCPAGAQFYDDEEEAARVSDDIARRLKGNQAHGGRDGANRWTRLNFPNAAETETAKQRRLPATNPSAKAPPKNRHGV